MNLFELSTALSGVTGLVCGVVAGAKAGAVGLVIGAPLGLVTGAACYFGLMGLSVLLLKVTQFGESETTTWIQEWAAAFAFGAACLSPILSGALALFVTKAAISLVAT
jgi:hypothetical protein